MKDISEKRLSDYMAEQIADEILSGRIPGGSQLKQEELAEAFEASRIPIREAFQILENQGLIIRLATRRITVTELDKEQICLIYSMISEMTKKALNSLKHSGKTAQLEELLMTSGLSGEVQPAEAGDVGGGDVIMPKGTNQKLKLYRLAQIMLENTDDEHYITMPEIMEELGKYEVTADRKTIYADLRDLSVLGIEVEGEPIGNRYHYRVVNRPFELPELKLLVDSIQSSKFITEKKTNTLIKKLEKLVSKYDAQRLQRQVYVSGRIKTMNESIYYTVDAIHNAISENKKIKFQYFQWNVKKEMELRHGGAWYHISPWGLSWDDENYYMIGYDTEAQLIKHYRVDKMLHIRMSDESREGKEHFKKLDMADYAKKSFGMFRGKETSVKMLVNNSLAGVIIDRFGKDVMMIPEDEDHFRVNVDVHVSKQFLGWVFSLGEAVKIIGPDEVVEQMRGEARRLMEQYGE